MPNATQCETSAPILVPVDFSPQSKAAALTASAIVGTSAVPLLLLHVVHEEPEQAGFYREHDRGSRLVPIADIAAEMLARFLGELRLEHPDSAALRQAETMVLGGLPTKRIVEVADQRNALMIVMGSRGRTGLPHWLLGSVAEQVSRHSARPVTIVKDAAPDEDRLAALQSLHAPAVGADSGSAISSTASRVFS